jgi:aconitate hydratase 2/2-methylisocitrate dehydratase
MSPNAPRLAFPSAADASKRRADRTAEEPAGRRRAGPGDLITYRVPAGVDDAAKVKASYLAAVALGKKPAR